MCSMYNIISGYLYYVNSFLLNHEISTNKINANYHFANILPSLLTPWSCHSSLHDQQRLTLQVMHLSILDLFSFIDMLELVSTILTITVGTHNRQRWVELTIPPTAKMIAIHSPFCYVIWHIQCEPILSAFIS